MAGVYVLVQTRILVIDVTVSVDFTQSTKKAIVIHRERAACACCLAGFIVADSTALFEPRFLSGIDFSVVLDALDEDQLDLTSE